MKQQPIPFVPRPWQPAMLEHIAQHPRCAVWAAMGSGKTVATLVSLQGLDLLDEGPALIIAPKRVAQQTWPKEAKKWANLDVHVQALTGIDSLKLDQFNRNGGKGFFTTNYEQIPNIVRLFDPWPFKTIILDESTRCAGFRTRQGTKRMQILAKVAWLPQVQRLIQLTGTPAPNGLKNLWGQLWFLDKGERLGSTYNAFTSRWFAPSWDGYGVIPFEHSQSEIQDLISDLCITIDPRDYMEVDEPIETIIEVELPHEARKLYREMERAMFFELSADGADVEVEAFGAASRINKCLQIANGFVYHGEESNWAPIHEAKLDALESIVEEAGGMPLLVSYQFKTDLLMLKKRFPKGRTLDEVTEDEWNEGRVPLLFVHPACLHPSTEVLTEHRGWIKIVDIEKSERVFDGVEFVAHKGCSFSGVSPVVQVLGLTLTPQHKLLIGQEWVEARDVRDSETTKRTARYVYEGDDRYLSAMLPLRNRAPAAGAEHAEGQSGAERVLSGLLRRQLPSHDRHADMAHLAAHGSSRYQPRGQGLQAIWRRWSGRVLRLVGFQKLLPGYVRDLSRRSDDRPARQLFGLQQRELSVGHQYGAAVEQDEQPHDSFSRQEHALGRILPRSGRRSRSHIAVPKPRPDGRGGACGACVVSLQEKPQVSEVYDLVDCGPRSRFLVRNPDGDVFISHNSAGHGLNLQWGSNILVDYSSGWNLEHDLQTIERIGPMRQFQAGLNRAVYRYRLVALNTVDEMVAERRSTKASVQDILLAAMKRYKPRR